MPMRFYRPTVVVSALSWFLMGLHLPAIHQMTHHGEGASWIVLGLTSLFAVSAVAGLWLLLRVRAS